MAKKLYIYNYMHNSYSMVRETKKPSFIRLDKRTNEELKTQTKMLCEVRNINYKIVVEIWSCTLFSVGYRNGFVTHWHQVLPRTGRSKGHLWKGRSRWNEEVW